MNQDKISRLVNILNGLNQSDWSRVKKIIDMSFSSKAAKVELDDSNELKRDLEIEFNFQRFGEKLD